MHEPVLQSADVASMGCDGTWAGKLVVWLSERDVSVLGGDGLPWRCTADECLVDMTTVHKKMLSEGCCEVVAWRCSDMLRHDDRLRVDLVSDGGWFHRMLGALKCGGKWWSAVTELVEQWRAEHITHEGTVWRWDPMHVLEHRYLAQVTDAGEVSICQVRRSAHNDPTCTPGEVAVRTGQVRWLTKERRCNMVEHCTQFTQLRMWLQYRGGWGEGPRTRHNDKTPHQEWIWSTVVEGCEYEYIAIWYLQTSAKKYSSEFMPLRYVFNHFILHPKMLSKQFRTRYSSRYDLVKSCDLAKKSCMAPPHTNDTCKSHGLCACCMLHTAGLHKQPF